MLASSSASGNKSFDTTPVEMNPEELYQLSFYHDAGVNQLPVNKSVRISHNAELLPMVMDRDLPNLENV